MRYKHVKKRQRAFFFVRMRIYEYLCSAKRNVQMNGNNCKN